MTKPVMNFGGRCSTRVTVLRESSSSRRSWCVGYIEDWLAIDSWLGGGNAENFDRGEKPDLASVMAFRAVAMVASMSIELADAAVAMVTKRRYYAVGAVIRQLIECEYLLVLFGKDRDHARRWGESTPAEIRSSFSRANALCSPILASFGSVTPATTVWIPRSISLANSASYSARPPPVRRLPCSRYTVTSELHRYASAWPVLHSVRVANDTGVIHRHKPGVVTLGRVDASRHLGW